MALPHSVAVADGWAQRCPESQTDRRCEHATTRLTFAIHIPFVGTVEDRIAAFVRDENSVARIRPACHPENLPSCPTCRVDGNSKIL